MNSATDSPTVLRVAIADDEPLARMRLRRLLSAEPDLQIVWECGDGTALLEALSEQPVDAIFLDIEMPELDGFGTVRSLTQAELTLPMVVFCTAYDQYAPRAFDIDAVDYLLKPVQSTRLGESLERLRRQKRLHASAPASASEFPDYLSLPIGRRMHRIAVSAISVVLAQANYLEVRADNRSFVLRQTLANFSKQLNPSAFVRIHRSCVIRIGAVESIESIGSGRYRLRLRDGSQHYAARGYRETVRLAFGLNESESETETKSTK